MGSTFAAYSFISLIGMFLLLVALAALVVALTMTALAWRRRLLAAAELDRLRALALVAELDVDLGEDESVPGPRATPRAPGAPPAPATPER